jgi:hypothetical protein
MSYRFLPQALILSLALAAASFARASTAERLSFDRLIGEADVIVKGRVEELKTRQAPDRRSATTVISLFVVSQFKGAKVSSITIEQPGGAMGELTQGVPGLPEFASGENVIVFLKRQRSGAHTVVGGKQGKFSAKTLPGSNQEIAEDFAHRTEALDSFLDRLTKMIDEGASR